MRVERAPDQKDLFCSGAAACEPLRQSTQDFGRYGLNLKTALAKRRRAPERE